MAETNFIGCVLSVDCGETLGVFQGVVSGINATAQTISLITAFRNGIQCLVPEITISACDIQHLDILKQAVDVDKRSHLLSGLSNGYGAINGHHATVIGEQRSPLRNGESSRFRPASGARHGQQTTPLKVTDVRRRLLDDDCLNVPISKEVLETEFDFEKNLALFDKRAVFDAIEAAETNGGVAGGARLADIKVGQPRPQSRYRCDEHVLEQRPVVNRQIHVPEVGRREFVTDSGLVVPSVSLKVRDQLLRAAEDAGLSHDRQMELIGRAASDMVIQLLGGSHRLNPRNSHQTPTVVLLCGPCLQGVQALSCGRHLANHGVKVHAFVSKLAHMFPHFMQELALFKLTDGTFNVSVDDLPTGTTDIIINALDGHVAVEHFPKSHCYADAARFAANCKARVLTIDPPVDGVSIKTKWSLAPVLPLDLHPSSGSVYLCDLGIPKKIFAKVGITYCSPFGPKCVIALHNESAADVIL